MCSDEADIYPFDCELYHDYQPMVVTPDIEHVMLKELTGASLRSQLFVFLAIKQIGLT